MQTRWRKRAGAAGGIALLLLSVVALAAGNAMTRQQVLAALGHAAAGPPDLSARTLAGLDLAGIDFKAANLSAAVLNDGHLRHANLAHCNLTVAFGQRADFRDA